MNNTIITGVAALALATPAFAGEKAMEDTSMGKAYSAPSSELGLSGDLSLSYQNQFQFRGLSGLLQGPANVDTDVLIADINAKYSFTENLALVSGFTLDSVRQNNIGDQESAYIGGVYETESYALELGWRHIDTLAALGGSTSEIYASAAVVCPWTGATVKLLWAHDIDQFDGDYLQLSAVKGWELNDWASVELGAGISYSLDYWQAASSGNGWNSWNINLALPLKATDHITVTPYIAYTDGLSALEKVFPGAQEDGEVIWGIKTSVNF